MYTPVPKGYYETPHWKRKAAEARAYYGNTCQRCGRKGGWLDVHHTDEAYQQLWHEDVRNLKPLCHRRCHTKGRITAWRIAEDRKAQGFINIVDVLFSVAWQAILWPFRRLYAAFRRRA